MLNHVSINEFWDSAQESTSFHACLKNVCMWDTCTENCCDEKIHLYYFHHFICNLITRLYYLVMCSISNSNSNSILISILYIVFIYILHLHICFLCYLLSTHLLSLQSFLFKITFIIFAVYVFIVQLYICQCNCHSYLISFFLFIVLHLIFHIWSLYLIFVIIICEIFHYICTMLIIWYFLSFLHLFVHNIFFILIIDYHFLDLLTLTELITKFSTLILTLRIWKNCKRNFHVLILRFVYKFFVILFNYLHTISSSLKNEWSVWLWKLSSLILMIIFDFSFSLHWNFWLIIWIICDQWNFIIMFKHIFVTKFHLIISDHVTQHSYQIREKSKST